MLGKVGANATNSSQPITEFKNCTPPNKLAEIERGIAIAIAKAAYFVSPKVVQRIAKLNCEWRSEFTNNYGSKVHVADFFYKNSACVFPGVRRKTGKNERELKRHKYHPSGKAILDLNWFPRELWCFLCVGKKYSGNLWKTSGLGQFELAHVLPHKAYEVAGVKAWFAKTPDGDPFHGLFSCAANVILLPKGMVRPTDGTAGVRVAVLKQYFDLYGDTHAGGFGQLSLPERLTWFDQLRWNDPVESPDWEDRITKLDKFRKERIGQLLA
jgi:hypothetical protein